MLEFENTVTIDRPLDEVFDFVSHFENIPQWNYYVLRVHKLSDEPVGVGTTYHQVRKTDQQDFRITEYSPQQTITVKTAPGSKPKFERRLVFKSVKGKTRIVDTWTLETEFNPLFEKLGKGRVKKAVGENLDKLKQLLETGQTQLQDGRTIMA